MRRGENKFTPSWLCRLTKKVISMRNVEERSQKIIQKEMLVLQEPLRE